MSIELGISSFGETTPLKTTGKAISHDERIRDLLGEIILADELKIDAENFAELVGLLESEKISSKQGKQILSVLLENGGSALEWMKTLGMEQISDTKALTEMIQKVLSENPESVSDFKAGKDRAQKYLMGQIMKASKGQANPKLVTELLTELLNQM